MIGRNVEIKARLGEFERARRAAVKVSDSGPTHIFQEDTYFRCAKGRLKLRKFAETSGQLICYDRGDSTEPAECNYSIAPTSEPDMLRAVLGQALGIRGVVRKNRELYLSGETRIHLDGVEGLGHFVELEVVLKPGQSRADGERIAAELMKELSISDADLIAGGYIDLIVEDTA